MLTGRIRTVLKRSAGRFGVYFCASSDIAPFLVGLKVMPKVMLPMYPRNGDSSDRHANFCEHTEESVSTGSPYGQRWLVYGAIDVMARPRAVLESQENLVSRAVEISGMSLPMWDHGHNILCHSIVGQ